MVILASIVKYLAQLLPLLLIWWEYRLQYVDKDGRTIEHKRARKVVLILAIGICFLGFASLFFDDASKSKEQRELAQSNANLSNELREIKIAQTNLPQVVSRNVNELLIMATNSKLSDAALAVAIREKEVEAAVSISIDTGKPDFQALAASYQAKVELKRLQDEKARRDAELNARSEEQRVAELAKWHESRISEKTSPVFDYAVRTLHTLLTERARQNGEKLSTNYKGLPHVVRFPVEPVCQITAGDESQWRYFVLITHSPRTLVVKCADLNQANTNRSGARSWHTQKIDRELPGDTGFKYVIESTIMLEGPNLESILTSVRIHTKHPQVFPSVEDNQSYTNYAKCVDTTLGTLIGAHAVVTDQSRK